MIRFSDKKVERSSKKKKKQRKECNVLLGLNMVRTYKWLLYLVQDVLIFVMDLTMYKIIT